MSNAQRSRPHTGHRLAALALLAVGMGPGTGLALDLSDSASLGVTGTSVVQHGDFSGAPDTTRGSAALDLELELRPSARDTLSFSVGLATGNALNTVAPVSLAPYADDLQDDLRGINGTSRSYLLTAWYRRAFDLSDGSRLDVTAGLIDSTAYLDGNAWANDEVGQFMNDAFVNSTLANLPSYEPGAAVEWDSGARWRIAAVSIRGRSINEDVASPPVFDRHYLYNAAEVSYRLGPQAEAGAVRLMAYTTTADFRARSGAGFEPLRGVSVSADHALGTHLGGFTRLAWQDDAAVVTHDLSVSAGLGVEGGLWGRSDDAAGLGVAWLRGAGGTALAETWTAEAWVRVALTPWSDLTADLQYIRDDRTGGANDTRAWVTGLRANVYF